MDIFFVISGYLISTIIMGSLERNSFSFVEFYIRRINRIFPALLLVLVTCFAFGWFALLADEYKQLGKHIAGGAGFISNYLFWGESGYFDNAAETKPLLHLWSLGIEEQFYIVWPLLLWFVWKKKFNLLTVTLLIAFISFGLNVAKVNGGHLVDAFYAPQTRFWELLIGSILAYTTLHHQSMFASTKRQLDIWLGKIIYAHAPEANGKTLRNVQSLLGAAFFAIGFVLITREGRFPGWWAVLPTLGAVLIISAGTQAWFNRVVLSNRVIVWFGLISFPLYLWHWPLLSFARIVESETPSREIRIAAVLISIVLAWLTYRLIEKPIRFGGHGKGKTIALIILMCLVGYVGYNTFQQNGLSFRHKQLEQNNSQFNWSTNSQMDCVKHFGPQHGQYCLIDNIDQKPEILLIGDSNANHLYPGLNGASKGRNLLNLGRGGCLPFLGVSSRLAEGELNCQEVMREAFDFAKSTDSVKTVVLSMMGAAYINGKRSLNGGFVELHSLDDLNQKDTSIIFEAGMRKTLQFLRRANKNVIFVVSIPRIDFSPGVCFDSRPFRLNNKPVKIPCAITRSTFNQDSRAYRDLVFRVMKDFPEVKIFDTTEALCDEQYCWAMKDGKVLYRDDVHLSVLGSEYIAHEMEKQFPNGLLNLGQ